MKERALSEAEMAGVGVLAAETATTPSRERTGPSPKLASHMPQLDSLRAGAGTVCFGKVVLLVAIRGEVVQVFAAPPAVGRGHQ